MASFEDFTFYYAKSLAENTAALADLKIEGGQNNIKLVYCIPNIWNKRVTDTSNAQADDRTSPDTGTARAGVELKFTQERDTVPTTRALNLLLQMFYQPRTPDSEFRKARFGLSNSDNPDLDLEPVENAGYKLLDFAQIPNQDNPALNTYLVHLDMIGDHTQLGAFP